MDAHLFTGSELDRHRTGLPLRVLGDERLARLVGQGREAAFAELYGRYHQPLFRYCRSIVGSDSDAQDALQTALTRALIALRHGRRDAPLRPWLYRIAHNESISLLRRRRPEVELPAELSGSARPADETAEERAHLQMLLADLAELPERQRGALVMRELSGLGHEEIAAAFGISTGAAKQTIFEARHALQEFGEGRAMACEDIQRVVSDGDRRALRARRIRAHLRDCAGCRTFASAIGQREASLRALTPALPGAAAAGLFGSITGLSGGLGGGGAGGGTAATGLGGVLTGKALMASIAVLATATVGTEAVRTLDAPRATAGHAAPRARTRQPSPTPVNRAALAPAGAGRSTHPLRIGTLGARVTTHGASATAAARHRARSSGALALPGHRSTHSTARPVRGSHRLAGTLPVSAPTAQAPIGRAGHHGHTGAAHGTAPSASHRTPAGRTKPRAATGPRRDAATSRGAGRAAGSGTGAGRTRTTASGPPTRTATRSGGSPATVTAPARTLGNAVAHGLPTGSARRSAGATVAHGVPAHK